MLAAAKTSSPFIDAADEIIAAGKFLGERGWAPATAGNYSMRLPDGTIAMTVSGADKGALTRDQIMRMTPDGKPIDLLRPSAEANLHVALYQTYPTCNAVLHTHSVASTVLTRFLRDKNSLTLSGYELLKIFPEITTHDITVELPMVDNSQDMEVIKAGIMSRLDPRLAAYLIRGHGLYGWGTSMDRARAVIEATEFMIACELETRRLGA